MKVSAYHFFLKHAGYNYTATETRRQGRIRCAKALAQAERDAKRFGITFQWDYDSDGDDSWMTEEERREEHTCEWVRAVTSDGRTVASLGGIYDADTTYRRLIEAELAYEALASVAHR